METKEQLRVKYLGLSLRGIYLHHCTQIGMKSNSALAACLPDTVGVYDTVQELDLSRCVCVCVCVCAARGCI